VNYTHSRQLLHKIGVFLAHVLGIATKHSDSAIFKFMDLPPIVQLQHVDVDDIPYLCSFSIILVLACEFTILTSVQYFSDCLCRFRKHGFERDARSELAFRADAVNSALEYRRDYKVIRRKLAA
jgi:GrpB-like predicted nucleotidyltransferase (UPF0157 family)